MYESRCGILCEHCERKEDVHCTGCLTMKAPFWGGDCEVKTCCEKRELNHCGECPDFPCETMATMGVDAGFDPAPRLEACRRWADKAAN